MTRMIARWALSALLVICLLMASAVLFVKWLESGNGPASTSMKPREVTLVGHPGPRVRLRVPEAYINRVAGIEMIENGNDKYTGSVSIVGFLPDLLPKHLAEQAGHKVHGSGAFHGYGIFGLYLQSDDMVPITIVPKWPASWAFRVEQTKRQYTFDRDAEGFSIYYDTIRSSRDGTRLKYKEVLIPIGSEDAIIHCTLSQTGERLGCNLEVPPESDLIQFDFGLWSTHLPERAQIEPRVRALVRSFIARD
jgi:hypothetical protein